MKIAFEGSLDEIKSEMTAFLEDAGAHLAPAPEAKPKRGRKPAAKAPEPEPEAEPEVAEVVVSEDDLRAAVQGLLQAREDGFEVFTEILKRAGYSKISEIPEGHRADVLTEVKAAAETTGD